MRSPRAWPSGMMMCRSGRLLSITGRFAPAPSPASAPSPAPASLAASLAASAPVPSAASLAASAPVTSAASLAASAPVTSGRAPGSDIVALPVVEHGGHDLVHRQVGRVDDHGILRGAQGGVLAVLVEGIPPRQIGGDG